MKVKDLLKILKTDYIELSNYEDEYAIDYLKREHIKPEILEANVVEIIPIAPLRKQIFEFKANQGEYVAAIKLVYSKDDVVVAEEVKTESNENTNNRESIFGKIPFGFNIMNDKDLIDSLLTPEVMDQISNSSLFKDMLNPEMMRDIMNSDEFKQFVQNVDINDLVSGNFNPFGGFQNSSSNSNLEDDDDDEYEEI